MRETLTVRLPNWLGDTVMAVPAIRALRQTRPDARLALVGPWTTVFARDELADLVVPYGRSWSARLGRWDQVRSLSASVVIVLPNSFESALAAWYWRAPRRIGFDAGGRSRLLTETLPLPEPRAHQIDEYARLVEALGVAVVDRTPRLMPPPSDSSERATVRRLLEAAGAGERRVLVGIHLGAAFGSSKVWPAERTAELCRMLLGRDRMPVLLGAEEDVDLADRLAAQTGTPSLVGRDSPDLLGGVLTEVDALVCGDTGVGHLAAALGTPVVALFGPTDPHLTAPRGRVRVIVDPVPCAPCFYRTCPIDHPCLRGIGAERVADAIEAALADRAGAQSPAGVR